MSARDLKSQMRQDVQDDLSEPALYSAPGSVTPIEVNVRLHQGNRFFGDLDREGYGGVVADVPRIIFDAAEVMPKYRGVVQIVATGESFNIDVVRPQDGPVEVVCEVSEVRS